MTAHKSNSGTNISYKDYSNSTANTGIMQNSSTPNSIINIIKDRAVVISKRKQNKDGQSPELKSAK